MKVFINKKALKDSSLANAFNLSIQQNSQAVSNLYKKQTSQRLNCITNTTINDKSDVDSKSLFFRENGVMK